MKIATQYYLTVSFNEEQKSLIEKAHIIARYRDISVSELVRELLKEAWKNFLESGNFENEPSLESSE